MFISIEGADGAGKSLQAAKLSQYYKSRNINAVLLREPGATRIGELIRNIILDKNNNEMNPITEILLFAAARAQIVREVIKPSLEAGSVVICERFTDSTYAYQHYARGLDKNMVQTLNEYATGGLYPDLTFFLDIPPEVALSRKKKQASLDRLELEGLLFQQKVYEGYKKISSENNRVITINASREPEEIFLSIIKEITLKEEIQ
ncbi:MAG: dTMP kinase [Clostridiales bacterium]|jgi:dTMP kinase|nr:dTMP kinase [Clostridiales bacterium]